jgi:hypothetical protein
MIDTNNFDKYAPFNEETYNRIVQVLETRIDLGVLKTNKDLREFVWSIHTTLSGRETMPCTCGSSGHHWRRAMDSLRKYVDERK